MRISEKQILQLIEIARMCGHLLMAEGIGEEHVKRISGLIKEIRDQQSEELKEIK